jgi:hypothetical protein
MTDSEIEMQGPVSPPDPAVLEACRVPEASYLGGMRDFLAVQRENTLAKPRLEAEGAQSKTRSGKLKIVEKELSIVEKLPAVPLAEYKRRILERRSKKSAEARPSNRKEGDDSLTVLNNPEALEGSSQSGGDKNPVALTSKLRKGTL